MNDVGHRSYFKFKHFNIYMIQLLCTRAIIVQFYIFFRDKVAFCGTNVVAVLIHVIPTSMNIVPE